MKVSKVLEEIDNTITIYRKISQKVSQNHSQSLDGFQLLFI